jgi:hypothetical protein
VHDNIAYRSPGFLNYHFLTKWNHTISKSSFSTLLALSARRQLWVVAPFNCDKHSKSSHLRTHLMYNCQRILLSSEIAVSCCVNSTVYTDRTIRRVPVLSHQNTAVVTSFVSVTLLIRIIISSWVIFIP